MRKVMLVIDDFSEMVGLETFLRRLGFDVLSLAKETLVTDALLSFQPEIVIASFRGRNVDGPRLAARLKKAVLPPPRIALAYAGQMPSLTDEIKKSIEAIVEIPLEAESAIQMMAKLSNLPVQPILDKYAKVSGAVLTRDEQIVIITEKLGAAKPAAKPAPEPQAETAPGWDPQTMAGQAATLETERTSRYQKYLAAHEDVKADKVLPHDKAAKAMAKLKADSAADKDLLAQIQAEKLEFAKALFELKKRAKKTDS